MHASTLNPLGFAPGSREEKEWHAALGNAFHATQGRVCAVCGLGAVGHGPESSWLGYARHEFDGIPATPDMLARARALTTEAYAARRANGTHSYCGHRYAGAGCHDGACPHVGGHCGHCY